MDTSQRSPRLAVKPTQSDVFLGLVSIVLAFLLPFVSVFMAREALNRAKSQQVENRLASWGYCISWAMIAIALMVVAGTIIMNLIGMPIGAAL